VRPECNVFYKLSCTEQRREGVAAYLCKYPLEQIAYGICELHAKPIMLPINRWENLIKKLKNEGKLKLCLPSAVLIPIRAYPTIPLSSRSNLVRRYLYKRGCFSGSFESSK
jgi:hypothetical protein